MNVKYNPKFGTYEDYLAYVEIVNKVESCIDFDAAQKLADPPMSLNTPVFIYGGDLSTCFFWEITDDGIEYWTNIFRSLEDLENER